MARFNNTRNDLNKEGYNKIHDSITNAKSVNELLHAVENSLQLIKEYRLDDYQVKALEAYGMKKYERFLMEDRKLDHFCSTNKFKK